MDDLQTLEDWSHSLGAEWLCTNPLLELLPIYRNTTKSVNWALCIKMVTMNVATCLHLLLMVKQGYKTQLLDNSIYI